MSTRTLMAKTSLYEVEFTIIALFSASLTNIARQFSSPTTRTIVADQSKVDLSQFIKGRALKA